MKNLFKKCITVVLTTTMIMGMTSSVFADTLPELTVETVSAKTAYLKDIDEYGSNWKNDILTNNANVCADTVINQSFQNGKLIFETTIDGNTVTISAVPVGKTENNNVVFFDATVNNDNYSVVTLSYENNIQDSAVYFENYMNEYNLEEGNLLKIYLKDNTSLKKDYIIFEIFDYEFGYLDDIKNNLPVTPLLGAWVVNEFKPYRTEMGTPISPALDGSVSDYPIQQTFYYAGYDHTHTLTLRFTSDIGNVPVGGERTQIHSARIIGKTMSCPQVPNYNSSSDSSLHISDIAVTQNAIPNTAWRSTVFDGNVYKPSSSAIVSSSLSIKLGSIADLSISLMDWETGGTVDINDKLTLYVNTAGDAVRAVKTALDNPYMLTQIGHEYIVSSVLGDYGNNSQSGRALNATWNFTVENLQNGTYTSYTSSMNDLISIN